MAGLFIGGTIHDVAQVVGAGYTLGTEAGAGAASPQFDCLIKRPAADWIGRAFIG